MGYQRKGRGFCLSLFVNINSWGIEPGVLSFVFLYILSLYLDKISAITIKIPNEKDIIHFNVRQYRNVRIFAIKNNCFFGKKSFHLKVTFVKIMIVKYCISGSLGFSPVSG